MTALGDLVTIQRGNTYKSALLGQPGPVLLGLASIARNGGFRDDSLRTYGGDSPEKLLVHPGQLFASLKDVTQSADLLGSVARVPLEGPVGRLTQDTVRLDVVSSAVDPSYLHLALLTPQYRDYCRAHATGTTNLGLPREDFLAYDVPLPPLDEQRRIAGVFEALDQLVDHNTRLIAATAELARATFLAAARTTAVLGDVAQVTMGQSPPGTSFNEAAEGTVFYQGVRDFGFRFPTRRVWTTSPTRLAEAGAVLVAVRAPVGEVNVATERTALGRGLAAVQADGRQSILLQALTADPSIWDIHQGTGTVFAAINKDGMSKLAIPWADDDSLEMQLSSLDVAVLELHREVEDLKGTRDALLPLLMSGRIRARDVGGRVA